jgi:AcrR family transcriptional regulator
MVYASESTGYNKIMEWIPTPGSAKARLVVAAMEEFLMRGFEGVNVVELTQRIGVTTGVLYHHFGSKTGLYNFIREEFERRIVDRMDGAYSVLKGDVRKSVSASLLVGFDASVKMNACRILSEPPQSETTEFIAAFLKEICENESPGLSSILLASWRSALALVASGLEADKARLTLEWLLDK